MIFVSKTKTAAIINRHRHYNAWNGLYVCACERWSEWCIVKHKYTTDYANANEMPESEKRTTRIKTSYRLDVLATTSNHSSQTNTQIQAPDAQTHWKHTSSNSHVTIQRTTQSIWMMGSAVIQIDEYTMLCYAISCVAI